MTISPWIAVVPWPDPNAADTQAGAWEACGDAVVLTEAGWTTAPIERPRGQCGDRSNKTARCARSVLERQLNHATYLMASAGHDLRQPLQVISMVLDSMVLDRLRDRVADADLRYLEVASSEVMRMNVALSDLATGVQFDQVEAVSTITSVHDVLEEAAGGWRHHAAAKQLRLSVLPTKVRVRTNGRLLTTIVRNLVGNAVKYTPSGGVVVGCRASTRCRIDVVDSGPGLDPEHFEWMRQGRACGHPSSGGLGMGLAIASYAARSIGAELIVERALAGGTRFSVLLPAEA